MNKLNYLKSTTVNRHESKPFVQINRSKIQKIDFAATSKGFSIVELLIAGLLGLILLAGVIQLFLGSNRNYTMQEQLASVQEDGRFALMFMERQIQNAGWIADITETDLPLPVDFNLSSDGSNDTLVISFKTISDGINNRDCNDAVVADGRVVNTFRVSNGSLICQGNGGGVAQPLLDNIDVFQILYGVETDGACPDGVVNNYLNFNDVVNRGLTDKVLSIRMGILISSEGDVLPEAESKAFTVLNVTHNSPSDQKLRRLFQQTVFMPNAAFRAIGTPQQMLSCMAASV